jgi:hypothetical protein
MWLKGSKSWVVVRKSNNNAAFIFQSLTWNNRQDCVYTIPKLRKGEWNGMEWNGMK